MDVLSERAEGGRMSKICSKIGPVVTPARVKILFAIVILLVLLVAVILYLNFVVFNDSEWIHVHLVAHTHDDVGWLNTPEQYYEFRVKIILDKVVQELQKNPMRKFSYVEIYFFWKWWLEQTDAVRNIVRQLIENNQLEIIGGGWCMSDEAVTYYQNFIDQSAWGFRRLNDTFGPLTCPKTAWQIDTFGHSKGIASLLAQMGFNSLFFARLDFSDREYRKSRREMEFLWKANENLGESGSIFTSIFYDHYSAPKGFDFEMQPCRKEINFRKFARYVRKVALSYKTNHILMPMGDDFRFVLAKKYFDKMDMLVRFFDHNVRFKIRVFYSTPSQYIRSLKETHVKWPEKRGDFFPYSSDNDTYWTGFYTSRPTLKYFSRLSSGFLQVAKHLLVFSNKGTEFEEELTTLREAVGVLQHHDAITGTAQQEVTDYYSELLHRGVEACKHPVDEALGKLSAAKGENTERPIYKSCLLLNVSVCDVTEMSSRFVVTAYNPLAREVNHYVRVPVIGEHYHVRGPNGEEVRSQVVALPKSVRSIPGRMSTAKAELVFKAEKLPPMGFKSFYVAKGKSRRSPGVSADFPRKSLRLLFDPNTQLLQRVETERRNFSFSQDIRYYQATSHYSGAYLFKPDKASAVRFSGLTTDLINDGDLVAEYEQRFSDWASQVVRLYKEEEYLEVEWLVGPIPTGDYVGREVILVYSSDINSGKEFHTDVNGMQMEKRVKDHREWKAKILDKVSGNYYPVTSMISIKDGSSQMNVIVDRAQGGSSLRSGEIELMVHRRLCRDDEKGVDEALNETAFGVGLVARGRHWVLLGEGGSQFDQKAKLFAQARHSEPWLFFFDASSPSFEDWTNNYVAEFSGLCNDVPRSVRILTLEPWGEGAVLIRLEHIFDRPPLFQLSNTSVLVSLKNLFKDFDVLEASETALGADRWLSDTARLKWQKPGDVEERQERREPPRGENMTVSLRPQEIRTFILRVKPRA